MRRVGAIRHAEEAISDLSGNVDLARGARNDVDLHQLLPPGADLFPVFIRGGRFGVELIVEGGITLGIQSKLQRLHAVVLREVGHEGREGPWRRGGIEKDLVEGRRVTRHGVSGR